MKRILLALVATVVGLNLYAVSPSGSTIPITDSAGASWSVVGGVVQRNGANFGYSANVTLLEYCNGVIYQQNKAGGWWSASGTATWTATTAPTNCTGTSSSSSSSSSSGGSTSSSSSSSSSGGPPAVFGVRASGNKLVSTLNGAPVQLIGATLSCFETNFAPARAATCAAAGTAFWGGPFKAIHPGTNAVRVAIDACTWVGDTSCAPANPLYQTQVKKAVADMTSVGLYVIINMHWSAPVGYQSIGQPGFPDATHAVPYWTSMAQLYGQQPNVIFDPFNEPYGANVYNEWMGSDQPFLANGGSYSPLVRQNNSGSAANGCSGVNCTVTTSAAYQVEGELQILSLIRVNGATNLVLLSPMGWAGEPETFLPTYNKNGNPDPMHNVGMSEHAYA